eukprot:280190-Rhodomonas_salina.1
MVTLRWMNRKLAVGLLDVLSERMGLTYLELQPSHITDEEATRLAGALRECKALARLDLKKNEIGAEGLGGEAGWGTGSECKALAHLDLSDNNIGVEGAAGLAGTRGECKALTRLDSKKNEI